MKLKHRKMEISLCHTDDLFVRDSSGYGKLFCLALVSPGELLEGDNEFNWLQQAANHLHRSLTVTNLDPLLCINSILVSIPSSCFCHYAAFHTLTKSQEKIFSVTK